MSRHGLHAQGATGDHYAVVSGCPEATAAAIDVLESGGNVVDAALAASAVLCVVLPQAVSIGGDLFALVKAGPDARPVALNATGGAPLEGSVDAYRARGHRLIPVAGPLSIQTPGLVAGWQALADRWASRPLADLLKPAIACAADGVRVTPRLAHFIAHAAPEYAQYSGFRETFSLGGQFLQEGDLWIQSRLARTLETIASKGAAGFYDGWVAQDIARTVRDAGGFLSERDLLSVKAGIGNPLSVRFRNVEILTQPPISQGVVLLRALRILAARVEDPRRLPLAQYWCEALGALQTAFRERLALMGDHPDMTRTAAELIESPVPNSNSIHNPVSPAPLANTGTETTTLAVMDRSGNAISIIQSVFADLGCGLVSRDSGVLLNNRLSAFFLDPEHPNGLKPGRRTMHTLHSFMAQDEHGVRWAGGSPGGDVQPQVNLQILARLIDYGEAPEQAVAAPRWALMPGTIPVDLDGHKKPFVRIDAALDRATRDAFSNLGLKLVEAADDNVGSAKIVGRLQDAVGAWCDRRRDAVSAAG